MYVKNKVEQPNDFRVDFNSGFILCLQTSNFALRTGTIQSIDKRKRRPKEGPHK